MKSLVIISTLIFLFAAPCFAGSYYIRPSTDCTYDGNGLSWACAASAGATGARKGFPATLARDNTYYVAAGTYSGQVTLSTAVDGTKYIYIKKATAAVNSGNTGWNNDYGTGQAVFTWLGGTTALGVITIKTSYFDIDGVTGGYPNWTSGHGIKVTTDNPKATLVSITHNGTGTAVAGNIHLYRTELAHTGSSTNVVSAGGYGCIGIMTKPTSGSFSSGNHHFAYNYLHDSPSAFSVGYKPGSVTWEYNYFDTSSAYESSESQTQGAGITSYGAENHIYRYNIFKDIKGSCGTCLYTWHNDLAVGFNVVDDIKIYGNTFFYSQAFIDEPAVYVDYLNGYYGNYVQNGFVTTDGGAVTVSNVKVYNNTFSRVGGMYLFWLPSTVTGSGNEIKNNIFYQCMGATADGGSFNNFPHSYNWFYGNTTYPSRTTPNTTWATAESATAQIGTADPFKDMSAYNFNLDTNTACGDSTIGSLYATDLSGNTRPAGNWSRGCFQGAPAIPTNLQIKTIE